MSAEENKAIVRRAFEEWWNTEKADLADELFSQDYLYHDPGSPDFPTGPEGAKQRHGLYHTAFPDLNLPMEDLVVSEDKVVVRWTAHGTHGGDLQGIAPTGNQIEVTGIGIFRIAGGKIAEEWESWDSLGLMQQLGVVPKTE